MIAAKSFMNSDECHNDPVGHMRHACAYNPHFKDDGETAKICSVVLDDPRFELWSGSHEENKHHYGKGGLAQHTKEVWMLCLRNSIFFGNWTNKKVNEKVLWISAIWHDMGKMWDYDASIPRLGIESTDNVANISYAYTRGDVVIWKAAQPHKRNINHLCRSAVEWSKAADRLGVCKDIHDEVLHCILAHHGNFGSPVLPNTREAWLLHTCDQMSARMDDCDRLDLAKKY